MKKKAFLILFVLLAVLLTACGPAGKKPPYPLRHGAYGFENAAITDIMTNETTEKSFDDILNDKTLYEKWGVLFDFGIGIDETTEYLYKSDKRCYVLRERLAFETVGENTLKLHFPRWRGYEVVVILGWQQLYG